MAPIEKTERDAGWSDAGAREYEVHDGQPSRLASQPHQHQLGERQHDEGDDEQDQAERDQRGGVEVADRLGEFVGDAPPRSSCRAPAARR